MQKGLLIYLIVMNLIGLAVMAMDTGTPYGVCREPFPTSK